MNNFKPFNKAIKDERGIALVVVLMVVVVLSILGLSLLGLAATNIKQSSVERDYQATYYIAEAGVTYMLNEIKPIITGVESSNEAEFFKKVEQKFQTQLPHNYDDFEKSFGEEPKANLEIDELTPNVSDQVCGNDENKLTKGYKIISEGLIGERSRTVERSFCVNWNTGNSDDLPINLIKDMAVFSYNDITLNSSIIGNIGTNSVKPNSIYVDWSANLNGSIYKVEGANQDIVQKVSEWKDFNNSISNFPSSINVDYKEKLFFPPFPERLPTFNNIVIQGGPTNDKTINSDGYYQDITIDSDRTLTIDVGNQNRIIRVKNLKLNQGQIKVKGTGKLTLYIENTFHMNGSSKMNFQMTNSMEQLNIFYKGTNSFNPANAIRIVGSIYAESANISLGGSGQITGNIITGGNNIEIHGAGTTTKGLVFAPNAKVQLVGSGSVIGAVISDSFSIVGGSRVTYKEIDVQTLTPFFAQETVDPDISIGPIKETK